MNSNQKWHDSQIIGGIGAKVSNGDLRTALKVFKQEVKSAGIIKEVFDRREFVKRSDKKRKQKERAKFIQSLNVVKN